MGLTVRAELDPGRYPRGVKVSDARMNALPLARHSWHGEWNYTLGPQPVPPPAPPPPPAPGPSRISPHLLAHPALTGLTQQQLTSLITTAEPGWGARQEHNRYHSRGGPRRNRPGAGGHNRRLDLTGHLLVTALARHLSVPQHVIAALLGIDPTTIGRAIRDTHAILGTRATAIQPAPIRLRTLTSLRTYAAANGITLPPPASAAR